MAKTLKRLMGKAPLTIVRTTAGQAVYVYRGKPAPTNLSKEDLDRLLAGGFLHHVETAVDDEADSAGDFDVSTLGTAGIGETEKWVGKDKARAEQALAAEQAKPTDGQRPSLVTKLEKIIGA